MAILLFWVSGFLLVHSYFLYPLVLKLLVSGRTYPERAPYTPTVVAMMAVYNAEEIIKQKVDSFFESTYPSDKLHLYVGVDACTDNTLSVLQQLKQTYQHLHITTFENRTGKISIINNLYNQVTQIYSSKEFLLLSTDVSALFDSNCIGNLATHFSDKKTGIVGATIAKREPQVVGISKQEKTYYEREMQMKYAEGVIWGNTIGVFGACYMVRPSAFVIVPTTFISDDFYITMSVIEKGYSALFDVEAKVYMKLSSSAQVEYNRKVRIAMGNFQNLVRFCHLLWLSNSIWFPFLSHKVLRWLGPFFILICFVCSVIAAFSEPLYAILSILQGILILTPVWNTLLQMAGISNKAVNFLSHFYHMNLAILVGFFKFVRGVKSSIWEPTQRGV